MTTVRSNDPKNRALETIRRFQSLLEPKHTILRAIAGNGVGVVEVAGWPNYYWVRIVGKEALAVQAYCDSMIPGDGMHLNVEESQHIGQRTYKIVGRPDAQGWFTGTRGAANAGSPTPEHHVVHETGGSDMINVGPYQIENLRGGPTSPASMAVRVSWAPNIVFGHHAVSFPANGSQYKDSAAIVAPTWGSRFDLISVDSDLDINITTGVCSFTAPAKPVCPAEEIPVCWVLVKVGDTSLAGSRFWPANALHAVGVYHHADHEPGGDDEISGAVAAAHHESHEDDGADEVSVAGLSGTLADPQDAGSIGGIQVEITDIAADDVLTWSDGTNKWLNSQNPHAAKHEADGADEIDVGGLHGQLADQQLTLQHAANHAQGEQDEIGVDNLSGLLADPQDCGWLRGNEVSAAAPANTNVLAWDDDGGQGGIVGAWVPTAAGTPAAHHESHEAGGGDEVAIVFPAHAADHEDGGGDEISIAGLSGVAGDKQDADKLQGRAVADDAPSDGNLLAWDSAGDGEWKPVPAGTPEAHHETHESGGDDEMNAWGLVSAQIQSIHAANEVMNFPSIEVANGVQPEWWEEGDAHAALTEEDAAGEGITDSYERCLKVVTDGAAAYAYQRYTYADQPRLKSGKVVSCVVAVWSVGAVNARVRLQSSVGSLAVSANITAAAWTLVRLENVTLDGTWVDLRLGVDTGTAYFVPLGFHVGQVAIQLKPRGLAYRTDEAGTELVNADGAADPATWTDVDCTAAAGNLAAMVQVHIKLTDGTSYYVLSTRPNGSSAGTGTPFEAAVIETASRQAGIDRRIRTDDGQIFEYYLDRTSGTATITFCRIGLIGWWEWE